MEHDRVLPCRICINKGTPLVLHYNKKERLWTNVFILGT